jgi:hypothetical protein
MNKGVFGRPRPLILLAVKADRRVSIFQLEIKFNLSRSTIWVIVHEQATGKFAPSGFPVN